MTPNGDRWAWEQGERDKSGISLMPFGPYHPNVAEFWIRAFVAEVKSRKHSGTPLYALGEAFEEVTRELLGGDR